MRRLMLGLTLGVVCVTTAVSAGQGPGGGADRMTSDALNALELRNIGPTIDTGRVQDVAIDQKNPSIWYVASAFGGLLKRRTIGIEPGAVAAEFLPADNSHIDELRGEFHGVDAPRHALCRDDRRAAPAEGLVGQTLGFDVIEQRPPE